METFEDRSLNQFFGLESTNLIHFRGKFMTKSHKGFRIIFTHFISKTPHHSYNVGRLRIPVNALRPNIPVSLNIPKIMFLLKHVLDHFTLNSNNLQTNRCLVTPPFLRRRASVVNRRSRIQSCAGTKSHPWQKLYRHQRITHTSIFMYFDTLFPNYFYWLLA